MNYDYDAAIIGSGPNGLAAAITLAQAGWKVAVFEAKDTIGGGMRTAELTLPGYQHDICSAIHPTALASPFFRSLPLEEHGLRWVHPTFPLAHPFDDGTAAVLHRSIDETAATLGQDAAQYKRLYTPLVNRWEKIMDTSLRPIGIPPRNPITLAMFGAGAGLPANWLGNVWFRGEKARGFFAGLAAHSLLRMEDLLSSSFGLVLGLLGHAVGWPIPVGGSQSIANALVSYLESLGGEVHTSRPIQSMADLPSARAYLFNTNPHNLAKIAGDRLPASYRNRLERYRFGFGVFKVDYAIDGEIPWTAEECKGAGTIHLGATLKEIAISERAAAKGEHAERPYVLLAQQSYFDEGRAPEGKNTVWAYCHVPNGSTVDMRGAIENQIERFAPGFKERILAVKMTNAMQYQAYNPNYQGGDINGGVQDIFQLFTRPLPSLRPYGTPAKDIFLCSSSTPPGGGVHGMAGYMAASRVLREFS
jgi:phytoene dehydrogenase-like protein